MAIIVQDSFNRADNATTLGNADTGQTWTPFNSSLWGISSNQLYLATRTNNDTTVVQSGISDAKISVDIKLGSNEGIVFRAVDDSNYLLASITTTATTIFRRQTGTYTSIASTGATRTAGTTYRLEVTCEGTAITFKIDGATVLTTTSTFNQTATKHGLRNGSTSTAPRWDNFSIESLGTGGTGTDGFTAFDLRNSLYSDSFATSDTKQSLYADSSANADIRNVLYSDGSAQSDVKQTIYSDSASAYDTRITLYQDSATLFDTLQEFFSDGIVGSTPFDLRLILYADNLAVFDSRQAFFTDGVSFADLAQQFYQAGGLTADMKLVLYSDALSQFDAKQSLYSDTFINADTAQRYYTDGALDFDTLQAILDDWAQYREVIQFVLSITRSQSVTFEVNKRQKSELKL